MGIMRHLELAVRRMMTCRSISFQHSGALSPAWISCRGIYQRCSRVISGYLIFRSPHFGHNKTKP